MFAKKVIRQKENGEFQPIHRAGLLNLADYEIVEQYNAEARGLCNYYNLARGFLLLYHWGLSHPPFWRVFLFWFQVLLFGFRGVVCYALRVE